MLQVARLPIGEFKVLRLANVTTSSLALLSAFVDCVLDRVE